MKKILIFVIVILCLTFAAVSCGGGETEESAEQASQTETETEKEPEETDPVSEPFPEGEFRTPSDVYKLDLSKKDPSSEGISFIFDDNGKLIGCNYDVNGRTLYVSYNYYDGFIEISVNGADGDPVASAVIDVSGQSFDPSAGFSEFSGFYIFGYKVK